MALHGKLCVVKRNQKRIIPFSYVATNDRTMFGGVSFKFHGDVKVGDKLRAEDSMDKIRVTKSSSGDLMAIGQSARRIYCQNKLVLEQVHIKPGLYYILRCVSCAGKLQRSDSSLPRSMTRSTRLLSPPAAKIPVARSGPSPPAIPLGRPRSCQRR